MEEPKQSLLLNLNDLIIRINKINLFIHSDQFKDLEFIEQRRAIEQSIHMVAYRDVLRDRLFLPITSESSCN